MSHAHLPPSSRSFPPQVLSIFSSFNIRWPGPIKSVLNAVSISNLNVELVSPQCTFEFTYQQKWLVIQMAPILIVLGAVAIHYMIACRKKTCPSKKHRLQALRGIVPNRHLNSIIGALILLFYFVYIYCTKVALEVFSCEKKKNDVSYMRFDASVVCWEPDSPHAHLWPLALFFASLYGFGIPLVFFAIAWKYRVDIQGDQMLRVLGIGGLRSDNPLFYEFRKRYHKLYYRFKPKYYYWTNVILLRKFLIVFITVFLHTNPTLQASCALLVLFVSYSVHIRTMPYLRNDLLVGASDQQKASAAAAAMVVQYRERQAESRAAAGSSRGYESSNWESKQSYVDASQHYDDDDTDFTPNQRLASTDDRGLLSVKMKASPTLMGAAELARLEALVNKTPKQQSLKKSASNRSKRGTGGEGDTTPSQGNEAKRAESGIGGGDSGMWRDDAQRQLSALPEHRQRYASETFDKNPEAGGGLPTGGKLPSGGFSSFLSGSGGGGGGGGGLMGELDYEDNDSSDGGDGGDGGDGSGNGACVPIAKVASSGSVGGDDMRALYRKHGSSASGRYKGKKKKKGGSLSQRSSHCSDIGSEGGSVSLGPTANPVGLSNGAPPCSSGSEGRGSSDEDYSPGGSPSEMDTATGATPMRATSSRDASKSGPQGGFLSTSIKQSKHFLMDYNTMETVMHFCSICVLLSAVMFQAGIKIEGKRNDGQLVVPDVPLVEQLAQAASEDARAAAAQLALSGGTGERDIEGSEYALVAMVILIVSLSSAYFLTVLFIEMYRSIKHYCDVNGRRKTGSAQTKKKKTKKTKKKMKTTNAATGESDGRGIALGVLHSDASQNPLSANTEEGADGIGSFRANVRTPGPMGVNGSRTESGTTTFVNQGVVQERTQSGSTRFTRFNPLAGLAGSSSSGRGSSGRGSSGAAVPVGLDVEMGADAERCEDGGNSGPRESFGPAYDPSAVPRESFGAACDAE